MTSLEVCDEKYEYKFIIRFQVDEFSRLPECLPKLMGMLNAFIKPTFLVLNEIEAMRAR